MKIFHMLLVTHGFVAAITTAVFTLALRSGSPLYLSLASVTSLALFAIVGGYIAIQIRSGLSALELVIEDQEDSESLNTGVQEIDECGRRIGLCTERWESVAANTRQQSREIKAMAALLNRRESRGEPTSQQLRGLLSGLGNSLHLHGIQVDSASEEIQRRTKVIASITDEQGRLVVKASAYVEQLSSKIESVASQAASAKTAFRRSSECAETALEDVTALRAGIKRVEAESQACEKKLRALCDPSQQISAIVTTINDIAARTDLLALNASIESIRAGEHGRGFAVVADEVRKLAEQATDATREISSLVDSMQLVTHESICRIEKEHEQIQSELDRVEEIETALQQIRSCAKDDSASVQPIIESFVHQLQLAQDVVLAIEQVSALARSNREGADSISWTLKSLLDAKPQVDETIQRLQRCGGISSDQQSDDIGKAALAAPAPTQSPTPSLASTGGV